MTVAGAETREWQGVQFPTAGTWTVDPAHTAIEFQVKHLMLAKVKGRFADFAGALTIADDPTRSSVVLTIQAASIDTRTQQRDDHLRSADFYGTDEYPELSFTSTAVEHDGQTADPWGGQRSFFSAETRIDREDWGLTYNQALEAGGWVVGKEIKITLEVEASLQA